MPVNESFLQELKYKTDITDIVSTYVSLKKKGRHACRTLPVSQRENAFFYSISRNAVILLLWLRRRGRRGYFYPKNRKFGLY